MTNLIKPTLQKIILFLVVLLFLPVSYSSIPDLCPDTMSSCATMHFTTLYGLLQIFTGNTQFVAFYLNNLITLLASLVIGYLVVCVVVDLFKKNQQKNNLGS
jgi:hypothetical protein